MLEFQNAAKVMPKDPEPYYLAGLAQLEAGNPGEAVRAFRKALSVDPKHAGAELKLSALMTTEPATGSAERSQEAAGRSCWRAETAVRRPTTLLRWRSGSSGSRKTPSSWLSRPSASSPRICAPPSCWRR